VNSLSRVKSGAIQVLLSSAQLQQTAWPPHTSPYLPAGRQAAVTQPHTMQTNYLPHPPHPARGISPRPAQSLPAGHVISFPQINICHRHTDGLTPMLEAVVRHVTSLLPAPSVCTHLINVNTEHNTLLKP